MDKLREALSAVVERIARLMRPAPPRSAPGPGPGSDDGQRGQGLAEYALILAGIAVVAIASLVFLGGTISDLFWAPINDEFAAILSRLGI
jgi:Flp pilus assembly pilin Flp